MELRDIESIESETKTIKLILEKYESVQGREIIQVALQANTRIMEHCERLSKKLKSVHVKTAPEFTSNNNSKDCGEDTDDKERLIEQSKIAGDFVIPFGKHKGLAIKAVPCSYLCWLLGFRRDGREFNAISMDKHGWIISNHPETVANVKAYFTWRCWVCYSPTTRFKFSRLCTDCWHNEV